MNTTDKNIVKYIETKNACQESYWDFKNNHFKNSTFYTHSYPAKMVPDMQAELINIILENQKDIRNIFDPYMGSGTIIIEGLCRNLKSIGIDINPLAFLITSVRINKLSIAKLKQKSNKLFNLLDDLNKIEPYYFDGIEKWFNPDIIIQLSKIRHAIMSESEILYRNFFWLSFSEIVRLSNNSQKSTFKLHIKKDEIINNFNYDCIKNFKKRVNQDIISFEKFYNDYSYKLNNSKIYLGNTINIMRDKRKFKDNSIDLIVTSPPYGDNHTTVTYGQFSVLPLRWININDIQNNIDPSIIKTLTEIDKKSLGGQNYSLEKINSSNILNKSKTLKSTFNSLIDNKEILKARKVVSFYIDFYDSCIEMARILKNNHYAIFTIGNRRVNGNIIRFDLILSELFENLGLKHIYTFNRNIPTKRIPSKISRLKDNKPVYSIQTELTLILKKNCN